MSNSNSKIYMHSFYPDLSIMDPALLSNYSFMDQVMTLHKERDASLANWLKLNNIRSFPMAEAEFDKVAHLFKFLTESNGIVCLVFTKINAEGRDLGCRVLRHGVFREYPSRAEALKLLSGKQNVAVINAAVYTENVSAVVM